MKRNIRFKSIKINKSEGYVKTEMTIYEDSATNPQHHQKQLLTSRDSSKFITPIFLGIFRVEEISTFLHKLWEIVQGLFG